MKKIVAALGAIAFLLVLLTKPFDFAEVYSTHAGKMVQTMSTNTSGISPVTADISQSNASVGSQLLVGISNALSEASEFDSGLWMMSLIVIGAITLGASVQRKRRNRRLNNKRICVEVDSNHNVVGTLAIVFHHVGIQFFDGHIQDKLRS